MGITRAAGLSLFAVLLVYNSSVFCRAADKQPAAEPPAKGEPGAALKPRRSDRVPFHGKISAVDKKNMTISVEGKEKPRLIQITSHTRIVKAGKPATLDEAAIGEEVAGQIIRTPEGKEEASSLRIGARTEAPARKKKAPEEK